MAARGKVVLAQHLAQGDIPPDRITYEAMSRCLLCGTCVENCPNDVPTDEIVIAVREALATRRGFTHFHQALAPVLGHRPFLRMGATLAGLLSLILFRGVPRESGLRLRFPLPFLGGKRFFPPLAKQPFLDRYPEILDGEKGKPRLLFFLGCMSNFVYPRIGEAARILFRQLGCTLIFPKKQQCCGLPLLSAGDLASVRRLAEANEKVIEAYRPDYIVTVCASCGGALHKFYPRVIAGKYPELSDRMETMARKTVDAIQLLPQLGYTPAGKEKGNCLALTYHDPCHLRNRKITREPRELLRQVPGVQFREMDRADSCCGLGGTFNVYHYASSMRIHAAKREAILQSGADTVATGCPGCMMQISDGLWQCHSHVAVKHTLEILCEKL